MSHMDEETAPQQIDPATVPVEVRIAALEQALHFVMTHVKVTITTASPIIGGGGATQQMSLLDFYLQQLRQAQMVVGNSNGR